MAVLQAGTFLALLFIISLFLSLLPSACSFRVQSQGGPQTHTHTPASYSVRVHQLARAVIKLRIIALSACVCVCVCSVPDGAKKHEVLRRVHTSAPALFPPPSLLSPTCPSHKTILICYEAYGHFDFSFSSSSTLG